jgi:hypothetical protein
LRDHGYNQAGRITELEEQIGAYRNYGVDQAEEVTRLREALDEACEIIIVLTDDDESDPRIKAWRDKHTREALAGASGEKGAEDVEQTVGHNRESPDVAVLPVVDDSIGDSPTPLSEPLVLEKCYSPDGELLYHPELAFPRIEIRDAEIVAAIAEVRETVDFLNKEWGVETDVTIKNIKCDHLNAKSEMQAQISAQADKQDEMQVQIDRCKNRYDKLIPREFAETNRDKIAKLKENHQSKIEKMQAQIDALEGQASAMAVCDEEHMLAIERRIDALTERTEKIVQAVRMSLEEHRAVQQGMAMWGSGDFDNMLTELREMKGGE